MPVHAKGSDALFEVERRLCVKGGHLKGWITLPVIEVDGRECVMVSARSSFLTNMAFGNTAEHRHELTKLCAEVRNLLLRADGLTETASAQTEQSVGKSKLNLDADDDAAPAVRPSPSKKQKRGVAASWHEIQLRGVPVLCRLRCGQQILLQGTVEPVTSVVEALGRPSSREATDKPHEKADLEPITNDADNGRIKWRWPSSHRLGGWVVQYGVERNGPIRTKHSGGTYPSLPSWVRRWVMRATWMCDRRSRRRRGSSGTLLTRRARRGTLQSLAWKRARRPHARVKVRHRMCSTVETRLAPMTEATAAESQKLGLGERK